jgi:TonB-linked SusC/RagA family outer membrane protein
MHPPLVTQSLKEVLKELETQYHIVFTYKNATLENKVVTGFAPSSKNIEKVLSELLSPYGLKFRKINNIYVIFANNEKIEFKKIKGITKEIEGETETTSTIDNISQIQITKLDNLLNPNETTITGKVIDENNQPMPGVSVLIKGTSKGVATGTDGSYSLSGVPENGILVFSFIGYLTQEVSVSGKNTIDVQLQPDVEVLGDVVVVGYGTQKKSSVVAAISTVSSKDIAALPVPSVEQALQGRAPGVSVTNNGSPGEAPLVRIRGINSINYASNPLYVVDGIAQVGNFSIFDSKDIESVEVLKDANSAAIYGSRAAAGVVLITTKKGSRDGKIHVNLDSYVGTQSAWKKLDLLNRDQYLQYGTALLTNAGAALPPRFSAMNDPIYTGSNQTFSQTDTDWQKEMFQTAVIAQHNISVSGGNDKSRFYVSGGYFKQDGIMKGTGFERYNFRINSDHKISKIFTLGQTLLFAYGSQKKEQSVGGRTQIQNMIRMTPYIPLYNPTNIGGYGGPTGADASDPQNPVRAALQNIDQVTNIRVLGTVFLEAALTSWLKYKINVGADFNTSREYIFSPIYNEGFNSATKSTLNDNRTNYFSPIFTNQLTFDKTFGKHYINATAVIEYQSVKALSLNGAGTGDNNVIRELNGLDNQQISGTRDERVIYSYIGRLNYELASKYLFSASIRRDGASNFAPGKKFGNFPSVGIGWRISEEGFMKDISAVSELKFRGSYGTLGYIPGNYLWQSTVSTNTYSYIGGSGAIGAYYDKLPNTELAWEITKMANVGFDLGLLRNKITFSAEYFDRTTDNLILDVPPAPSTGYTTPPTVNVGNMRNWGYEFQAGYNGNSGGVKWSINGNIAVVKNNVKGLDTPKSTLDRGANNDYGNYDITRTEAGHPVQSFYGWQTDGIFQNTAEISGAPTQANAKPGDIRFKDINGDGKIDANDRTYLGSFLPKFTYGFNLSANYKGFDATMFFQGVQGNKIFNGTRVLTEGMLRLFNSGTAVLNAWTPTNTSTDVPRAVNSDPNGNARTSNRFIENGSYLRLKNLSIGYSFPAATLQKWTGNVLGNLRIYVASQNLITITKYKGYDPEIGIRTNTSLTQGIDYGQFPQARTFSVGLQAGF